MARCGSAIGGTTGTMGGMTRPPHTPRPAPPYRPPVARGQTYPPLGFAGDGTPRYGYTAPTPAAQLPVEPSPPPAAPPPPPRRDPVWRTVAGIASVLVLVLVVAGALKLMSSGNDDDVPRRADPPLSQPLDDPYLGGNEDPNPSTTPRVPSSPSGVVPPGTRTTPRPSGPPLPTLYEGVTEGQATVLYRDGTGTRVLSTPGGPWSVQATTTGVARVTVLVPDGTSASCRITIDGELVSDNQINAGGGTLRLLVCQN